MISNKRFFLIDDGKNNGLFKLKVGGDKDKLINDNNSTRKVRVVSNTTINNGIECYIYNNEIGIKNCITIATRGNDYFSCYQDDYTVTIVRTLLLYSDKFELNKYIGLYICGLLRVNKYKCDYGRVLSGDRLKLEKISLPVNANNQIDWQFMEDYIKQLNLDIKEPSKLPYSQLKTKLQDREWKYFTLQDVFNITRGKRLVQEDRIKGSVPYYSASEFNNGLTDYIDNPLFIEQDAIIYTTFGDCYYVADKFTASDEISIFKNNNLNLYTGIFICTSVKVNKYKYSFGRKAFKQQFIKDKIKLPIDTKGNPDWQFMEDYIKSLPYSKSLA